MVLSDYMRVQRTQKASEESGLTPPGAYPVCGARCTLHKVSAENMSQQVKHTDAYSPLCVHTHTQTCMRVYHPQNKGKRTRVV